MACYPTPRLPCSVPQTPRSRPQTFPRVSGDRVLGHESQRLKRVCLEDGPRRPGRHADVPPAGLGVHTPPSYGGQGARLGPRTGTLEPVHLSLTEAVVSAKGNGSPSHLDISLEG